jgi:shikimate dehydrogenase
MKNSELLKAGVMGWPIGHSLSPRLHDFWLRSYGINGKYIALPVSQENLGAALRTLPAQGLVGVNLTVPHKEAACAIVDSLDNSARRIGAVNLVVVGADGHLQGRNTDAFGFTQNLITSGFTLETGAALVLGAGGAARAVIVALIDMGFREIRIANRTIERAEKLAWEFTTENCKITSVAWHDIAHSMHGVSLLVHTTSLGMTGQLPLEIALDMLPQKATVTDIVYAPLETSLLLRARQRGHKTIDGLGMLLHQARPSFAAFFGREPQVTDELRLFVLAGRNEP